MADCLGSVCWTPDTTEPKESARQPRTRKVRTTIEDPGPIKIDGSKINENRLTQTHSPTRLTHARSLVGIPEGIPQPNFGTTFAQVTCVKSARRFREPQVAVHHRPSIVLQGRPHLPLEPNGVYWIQGGVGTLVGITYWWVSRHFTIIRMYLLWPISHTRLR